MTTYVVRRLLDLGFVLFGVSVLIFLMLRLIPGDAVAIMLGANIDITPERVEALRRQLGLHLPLHEQYEAEVEQAADDVRCHRLLSDGRRRRVSRSRRGAPSRPGGTGLGRRSARRDQGSVALRR